MKESELDILNVSLKNVQMVEAAAGTGKTYNITALVIRQLVEAGISIDQILVVTFTKAATSELKARITTRLRELLYAIKGDVEPDENDAFLYQYAQKYRQDAIAIERLEAAIREMDLAAIYTIHGFCQQVLREFVFESKTLFDPEFTDDDKLLRLDVLDEFWHHHIREWSQDSEKRPLVSYMAQLGNPEKFDSKLKQFTSQPGTKFYGESESLDDIYNNWLDGWQKMRDSYNAEAVRSYLESRQLNTRKYTKKSIPKFLNLLADFFQSDTPDLYDDQHFDAYYRFTISTFQEEVMEGKSLPGDTSFYENLEAYFRTCSQLRRAFEIYVIRESASKYHQKKRTLRLQTYDDILINLDRALSQPENTGLSEKLRQKYPAALIDEFQDTDPVQFSIFENIYISKNSEETSLFLIGDPKQSIYKFRGADIHTYLKARNNVKEIHTLSTNYRTADNLVQAINTLITYSGSKKPFYQDIDFEPASGYQKENKLKLNTEPLQLLMPASTEALNVDPARVQAYHMIAGEISRLLGEAEIHIGEIPLRAGDICVLVKSHKEAETLRQVLYERGIRSVMKTKKSVFDSDVYDDLVLLLTVFRDASNPGYVRALLCSGMCGFHISELLELEENEEFWLDTMQHFRDLQLLFKKRGFMAAFRKYLYTPIKVSDTKNSIPVHTLLGNVSGERDYTNLHHLAELINEFERGGRRSIDDILKWMQMEKAGSDNKEAQEMRLESDENLVSIMTTHASKGLQFPVVFCASLWTIYSDRNHEYCSWSDNGRLVLDLFTTDEGRAAQRKEELAEVLRQAYVALTRAQFRAYIAWSPLKNMLDSPLTGWLFGPEVYDERDAIAPEEVAQKIRQLAESEYIGVVEEAFDANGLREANESAEHRQLEPRIFDREEIRASWVGTSYSGIKRNIIHEQDELMEDEVHEIQTDTPASESGPRNIYGFPRGAHAGTFMHQIFEDIDFTWRPEKQNEVISRLLTEYDFTEKWHRHAVEAMVSHVLEKELVDSARLKNIKPEQCLKEMEFYFPAKQTDYEQILAITEGKSFSSTPSEPIKAFLKGFIDLIFYHQGKYYILDYKSDHLGNVAGDYSADKLKNHMQENAYTIQYHIYAVALKRYLKQRMPAVDFADCFGGAVYVFLRANQPGHGIYYDKPNHTVIENLDAYFSGK